MAVAVGADPLFIPAQNGLGPSGRSPMKGESTLAHRAACVIVIVKTLGGHATEAYYSTLPPEAILDVVQPALR